MTKRIHVGDVAFPLDDFAVARTGVLGITKSGKTFTAKGIAEQLLDAGVPIIAFDAIGVWHTLKVPGDGPRAKGYPIVVAGGSAPDLPLTPASAPEIVRAAIRENIPLVVDLYDPKLSKADWRRIVQACFRTLLYENRGVRHVFLEEAAEYAPQRVTDGDTYAEVEKLARMGGNKGVGLTFINQRAQELNKAVLELCDNLILLRQRGSHAIDSLEKWLDRVSPDVAKTIAKSLPHMQAGDCWVWTEASEEPQRTRSALLRSFHPDRRQHGAKAIAGHPPVNTKPFVERMHGELSALIERAKADDPKELRRQLAAKDAELATLRKAPAAAPATTVEVSVLTDADRKKLDDMMIVLDATLESVDAKVNEALARVLAPLQKHLAAIEERVRPIVEKAAEAARPMPATPPAPTMRRPAVAVPPVRAATNGHGPATPDDRNDRALLVSLARFKALGVWPVDKSSAGALAGQSPTSSAFERRTARLRAGGFLDYQSGGTLGITDAGVAAAELRDEEPLTAAELLNAFKRHILSDTEGAFADAVVAAYPTELTWEEVCERTGRSATSSATERAMARLRKFGCLEYTGSRRVRASQRIVLA